MDERPLWAHQQLAIDKFKDFKYGALFFDVGCIAGSMEIKVRSCKNTRTKKFRDAFRDWQRNKLSSPTTRAFFPEEGLVRQAPILDIVFSGFKKCVVIKFEGGELKCTPDHEILTENGFKQAGTLTRQDCIAYSNFTHHEKKRNPSAKVKKNYKVLRVGKYHPGARKTYSRYKSRLAKGTSTYDFWIREEHILRKEAQLNGLSLKDFLEKTHLPDPGVQFIDSQYFHVHHKDGDHRNNLLQNLEVLPVLAHHRLHSARLYGNFSQGIVEYRQVISVVDAGVEDVYDLKSTEPHNFLANNVVVHNCGKTRTIINIMRDKFRREKRLLRTIILSPPITLENWKREWSEYSKVEQKDVTVLYGSAKERLKILACKGWDQKGGLKSHIFVTNYETLLMPKVFEALKMWMPEAMICDEFHRCKTPTSTRTKKTIALSESCEYRFGLTGSPILGSILDLFSQVYFLDRGKAFGNNFFVFRAHNMRDLNAGMPKGRYFPNWQPLEGSEETIQNAIAPFCSYAKKQDCLDLPPLIRKVVKVEMSDDQRKMYTEMRNHLITEIKGKEIVATMALTKLLRLQQMASGFCRDVDGKDHEIDGSPKLEALRDLLEKICVGQGDKTIVWSCWVSNYAAIKRVCDELHIEYREVHGGVQGKQKFVNTDDFCKKPEVKVLIAHPESAGEGINLVEAGYSIYYSRTFSLKQEIQSEARNYRGGSEMHKQVVRYDLVTRDSVDELVAEKLAAKQAIGTAILEGIENYI